MTQVKLAASTRRPAQEPQEDTQPSHSARAQPQSHSQASSERQHRGADEQQHQRQHAGPRSAHQAPAGMRNSNLRSRHHPTPEGPIGPDPVRAVSSHTAKNEACRHSQAKSAHPAPPAPLQTCHRFVSASRYSLLAFAYLSLGCACLCRARLSSASWWHRSLRPRTCMRS